MKNLFKSWHRWFPIALSLVAIIISYMSYTVSRKTFEYEKDRDMLINTPAIKEDINDDQILFLLNGENAELQSMNIIFPAEIENEIFHLNTKPIKLSKKALEIRVQELAEKLFIPQDSIVTMGTLSIPVVIDYSAIVFGLPQSLRENRLFIFNIHCNEYVNVSYSNSYLINRCSFPLKSHYFYTGLFSKPLNESIVRQDQEDIQSLLKEQLNEVINSITKNKYTN